MSPTLVPQPNIKDQCAFFIIINGKLSSGQRIGQGQSASQSQRKEVPKNARTTVQLHSFHMLARLCSKSYKVGFSHEIKRCLLLGRKAMTNLDGILKSRDITLLTKVRIVKAMVFPVVMYGSASWTIKKADCQRIDALKCGAGGDS